MRRCLNCMSEYSESSGETCPYCGFIDGVTQNGGVYLQAGSILQGRYIVGTVKKARETDVFYIGWDALFERKVQIQEYFPKYCATRSGRPGITVYDSKEDIFLEGLELFYQQGRQLIRLYKEEDVVTCHACFLENGTAYVITEYRQEKTLEERLEGQVLRAREAEKYLYAAISAIQKAHEMGIYHGQIGLDSFWVTAADRLILKDFGASRYVSGEPGVIDYGRGGMQTDVYGLAKLFCRMITGKTIEAEEELEAELLRKAVSLNKPLAEALKNALRRQTPTIDKFYQELSGAQRNGQKRRRKKKQGSLKLPRWMVAVAAAAMASILVFTVLVATGKIHLRIRSGESRLENGQVRVPNVVNMEADKAEKLLKRQHLEMSREKMVYSKEIAPNMVSYQDIKENTAVDQNTTVTVWISMGEEKAVVPSVIGLNQEDARKRLAEAKFTNIKTEETDQEGVLDTVMAVSAEPGDNVALSTEITLYICKKEKERETNPDVQIEVPDMAGKTRKEAEKTAEESGFGIDWKEENSDEPEGVVLGQEPGAGQEADKGSLITIRVSIGAEKIYMQNVMLLTEDEARAVIEEMGLKVENVETKYSDTVGKGKVITQSIEQDSEVKKGDAVNLVVSAGKKSKSAPPPTTSAPPVSPPPTTTSTPPPTTAQSTAETAAPKAEEESAAATPETTGAADAGSEKAAAGGAAEAEKIQQIEPFQGSSKPGETIPGNDGPRAEQAQENGPKKQEDVPVWIIPSTSSD